MFPEAALLCAPAATSCCFRPSQPAAAPRASLRTPARRPPQLRWIVLGVTTLIPVSPVTATCVVAGHRHTGVAFTAHRTRDSGGITTANAYSRRYSRAKEQTGGGAAQQRASQETKRRRGRERKERPPRAPAAASRSSCGGIGRTSPSCPRAARRPRRRRRRRRPEAVGGCV